MKKIDIYQKLEDALCDHKTGQKKLDGKTASFLQFWAQGGVHKAVEKMGYPALRQKAVEQGVSEEIIGLFDDLFSP